MAGDQKDQLTLRLCGFALETLLFSFGDKEPSLHRFWRHNTDSVAQSPQPPVLTRNKEPVRDLKKRFLVVV